MQSISHGRRWGETQNLSGLGKSFFRHGLIADVLRPLDSVLKADPVSVYGGLDEFTMHAQPGNDVVFADLLLDLLGEPGYFSGHLLFGPGLYRFHHLSSGFWALAKGRCCTRLRLVFEIPPRVACEKTAN